MQCSFKIEVILNNVCTCELLDDAEQRRKAQCICGIVRREVCKLVVESNGMNPQVLVETSCMPNHLDKSLVNIQDAESVRLGALWKDYDWSVSLVPQEARLFFQLFDTEVCSWWSNLVHFWKYDSEG